MANTKISQLPLWSGTAADLRWFVMNNSGETETYKFSGYATSVTFGSGTNSIKSVNATSASGTNSISIGNTASATGTDGISIGNDAVSAGIESVSIGKSVDSGAGSVSIGANISSLRNNAGGRFNVLIGNDIVLNSDQQGSVFVIGETFRGTSDGYQIQIGNGTGANSGRFSTQIGNLTNAQGNAGMSIGLRCAHSADNSIMIMSDGLGSSLASNFSTLIGGYGNNILAGTYNTLLGGNGNSISSGNYNGIFSGQYNLVDSSGFSFIAGGYGNTISGGTNYSSILGGQFNSNGGNYSSIVAGRYNNILSAATEYSTIIGSYSSTTGGDYSHIFGGVNNRIDSEQAVIVGGRENYIGPQSDNSEMLGSRNSVISGQSQDTTLINTIDTNSNGYDRVVMLGTSGRTATSSDTTYTEKLKVMGKLVEVTDGTNTISDNIGSLIVGKNNTVTQDKYNIVLGESNSVTGAGAPGVIGNIVNGIGNSVSTYSTGNFVTGGYNSLPAQGQNFRMGNNATINGGGNFSMGEQAGITGNYSFIFGNYSSSSASNNLTIGDNNTNSGTYTFNFGTLNNTSASYSVAIGGYDNDLSGGSAQGIFVGDTCDISSSEGYNTIVNGKTNVISGNAKYGTIINGEGNSITGGTNVIALGLTGRTVSQDNTTHVENLHIYRTPSTTVQPISSGTTFTCDLNNGGKAQYSLTGNTTIDITNVRDGQSFMVKTQTNGNYTITWTATGYTFVFEGGIKDPGNTTTDIFVFEVFGTTIYGNRRHNYS